MVSTYASYNSVVRNLNQSMTRIGQQADVKREAAYYQENIGKVQSVDDLLKDYRLYNYAMKAYGLEDMAYAKAFMKKVLESNLADSSSFANRLSDKRYRDFAAAFSFSGAGTKIAQSKAQTDEMVGLYTASVKRQVDAIDDRTAYYNATIGKITNVDQLLNDDALRSYVFSALGIDQNQWSRETLKGVLTSDPADPNSYVNTVWVSKLPGIDASIEKAKAEVLDAETNIATYTEQLSQPGADMNDLRAKLVIERTRVVRNTGNIISFNDAITTIGRYVEAAKAFDFLPDGSLAAGVPAQTSENRDNVNAGFINSQGAIYLAANEANETRAIGLFRANIANVKTAAAFVSTPNVFNFALKSVGLDPDRVSKATIKAVLESDPNDPKSFAYTLRDERYVELARAFNFDAKGGLTTSLVAQDSTEVVQTVKDYIIAKTRFADPKELAGIRASAEKEAIYYQKEIATIDNVTELLADRKLIDVMLVARGLQPEKVSVDYLKKIFSSDLKDPKSFANTEKDPRFGELAASFNFDKAGKVVRLTLTGPQTRNQLVETEHNYIQQTLEANQGQENPGVRLALYFERKASTITSVYDILADKALSEVFRTTFNLPDSMGATAVDQQAKVFQKHFNFKDLSDSVKLGKFLSRFSAMYDSKNSGAASSTALSILQGK